MKIKEISALELNQNVYLIGFPFTSTQVRILTGFSFYHAQIFSKYTQFTVGILPLLIICRKSVKASIFNKY